jgi:hypothetical protein
VEFMLFLRRERARRVGDDRAGGLVRDRVPLARDPVARDAARAEDLVLPATDAQVLRLRVRGEVAVVAEEDHVRVREEGRHDVRNGAHRRVALLDLCRPLDLRADPALRLESNRTRLPRERIELVRDDRVAVIAARIRRDDDGLRRVEDEGPVALDDRVNCLALRCRVRLRPTLGHTRAGLVEGCEKSDASTLGVLVVDSEVIVAEDAEEMRESFAIARVRDARQGSDARRRDAPLRGRHVDFDAAPIETVDEEVALGEVEAPAESLDAIDDRRERCELGSLIGRGDDQVVDPGEDLHARKFLLRRENDVLHDELLKERGEAVPSKPALLPPQLAEGRSKS